MPHSHACHSGARDFPELRVYSPTPLGLVHLRFHFGLVVIRFVEVASVSTRLIPFFLHMCLTLTHANLAPVISRSCPSIPPNSPGSSPTGITFWPRFHAFCGSSMREYKAYPLLSHMCFIVHSLSLPRVPLGRRDFQQLRVYSPTSLGPSSAPEIPFWPRCHAFRGSGRRQYKAPRVPFRRP